MAKRPACTYHWTTLFYGSRGTCKSLHQGKEMMMLLRYLGKLYRKRPYLHRAIVVTNQKMNADIEKLYLGQDLFYFNDNNLETLRYCPRKGCWRGNEPHKLHGCYLFIDDISNMMPATDWATTPKWLKKLFIKGRKFGIHIVATLVDPFDLVIAMRRTTDVAFKFQNIWKTRDPDETMPALKHVFGWYRKRYISGEMLWKYGDLPEQVIQLRNIQQEEMHARLREMDKAYAIVYDDSWYGRTHFFNRSGKFLWLNVSATDVYDTLQDVSSDD
jgi:hypothetical protein